MALTTNAELVTAVQNWLDDTTLSARAPEFINLGEAWIWRKFRTRGVEEFVDIPLSAAVAGGTATGTADAITLTPTTALAAYAYGTTISFTAAANNTAATTVNVSGLGAKDLKKGERDNLDALEANDILSGATYAAWYDGTQFIRQPYAGAAPLPSRYRGLRRVLIDGDPTRRLNFHPPQDFWQRAGVNSSDSPTFYTIEGDSIVFAPVSGAAKFARVLYYRRPSAVATAVPRLFRDNPDLYLYAALTHASPYLGDDIRSVTWAAALAQIMDDIEEEELRDRFSGAPLEARSSYFGG